MTVLHWRGKSFSGVGSFEPDGEGFDKFRSYLQSSAKIATKLLIDVIEEDFRQDTIPHVYGKDRKAVISRLIDRYYRSSRQYTYAEVFGRQKTGRKDSNILIGAITNPGLILPWIEIIDECDIALSGIWSLPLLSKKLLPYIDAKKGPVLLVSQQVNSNLRQTFFRDGKMLASRQSIVNQDAHDISNIGTLAAPELERTINFLRNQRQIGDEEVVDVHIMASTDQVRSLENIPDRDPLLNYHIHRLSDMYAKVGIRDFPEKFSDGLFAKICMDQLDITGHYGNTSVFSRFYFSMASAALYILSVVLIIAGLVITESNITEAMMYEGSEVQLSKRQAEYRRVYREKYESYESVFADANLMNSAVRLAERIEKNSQISPQDFLRELSNTISQPQFGTVYIDKIEWKTQQLSRSKKRGVVTESVTATNPTSDGEIQHVGIIHGRIPVVMDNFRSSVDHISNIIRLLQENKRVVKVEAIELPVEVRSDKKFSSESGEPKKNETTQPTGKFVIKIVMNGDDA
jgi:hypothetical protein